MIELNKKTDKRFQVDVKKLKSKRPILTNVHYSLDGHVEMTNSFMAMRLKNVYTGSPDLKHGIEVEKNQKYPNMNHIFDQYEFDQPIVTIKTKQLEDHIETFKSLKADMIQIIVENDTLTTIISHPEHIQHGMKNSFPVDSNDTMNVTLNYKYILLAVKFMRMIGCTEIDIKTGHTVHDPISLSYKNVETIVMKIKKN